ncbi:hypothetical protein CO662_35855 [Rhizobium anhuiense]|uniref:Uncharacterized protein n=2 Tax=Rhizobium TaxID=379 RepID=A0A432NQU1_9HYPH|nr:hypothetical protein CO665_33480 [Rhizobium anhuiense]PDS77287.1 hypothetical protein CO654_34465 [Rhizobium sp. L18]PDT26083.1 hypothetical protein CO660_29920 [Rhizobium sp. L9]PDV84828.1 hypothetical protein CO652_30035 [Rhizobium sp. H4]RUM01773.1 hypothetical protein EFR84_22035 [Rhizobium chutanense]
MLPKPSAKMQKSVYFVHRNRRPLLSQDVLLARIVRAKRGRAGRRKRVGLLELTHAKSHPNLAMRPCNIDESADSGGASDDVSPGRFNQAQGAAPERTTTVVEFRRDRRLDRPLRC